MFNMTIHLIHTYTIYNILCLLELNIGFLSRSLHHSRAVTAAVPNIAVGA